MWLLYSSCNSLGKGKCGGEEWKGGGVGGRERQGKREAKEDIPSVSLKNVLANSVAPPLLNVIVNVPFLPVIFIQDLETLYSTYTDSGMYLGSRILL